MKKSGQEASKKKDAGASASSKHADGGPASKKQQGQAGHHAAGTAAGPSDSTLPGHHYAQTSAATAGPSPLSMFLHLDPPKSAKSLNAKIHKEQIHPSILRLALQYADFRIVGANARCIAMLDAFKDVRLCPRSQAKRACSNRVTFGMQVISSYTVPPGKSLIRHLPTYLSPQITHLVQARPMAISMGNAIRYLKWEISHIPPDMQDDDVSNATSTLHHQTDASRVQARELLCERIDHFIRDRIVLAGKVVEDLALSKIKDDDVILTFGRSVHVTLSWLIQNLTFVTCRSSLVEGVLLAAKEHGKRFSVIIVDSRPMHEGKNLLRSLLAADIPSTYVLLSSVGSVLSSVSLTLLGAAAMLSNGAMFSRAGSATVAMISKAAGRPVVCCCETYKFSDRIMLDSIVGNELGKFSCTLEWHCEYILTNVLIAIHSFNGRTSPSVSRSGQECKFGRLELSLRCHET